MTETNRIEYKPLNLILRRRSWRSLTTRKVDTSISALIRRFNYIYPLLDAEIIQMTIPNKPNSRNQKYQLTAKGLELIEHLKRNK